MPYDNTEVVVRQHQRVVASIRLGKNKLREKKTNLQLTLQKQWTVSAELLITIKKIKDNSSNNNNDDSNDIGNH